MSTASDHVQSGEEKGDAVSLLHHELTPSEIILETHVEDDIREGFRQDIEVIPIRSIQEDKPADEDGVSPNDTKSEKQKVTPLPIKEILVVFIMYLCDAFSFTTIAPYLGSMVKDFGISGDEREIGYYAGFIVSSYFFAQFFSSIFWGFMSDKFGRRKVLLFGLFASCFTSLLFGFSKYLWWAIAARVVFGLANGNLGVYKTYIGEITDSTNQAKAFSYIGLTYAVGSIIGPVIGGFLSFPKEKGLPHFFTYLPHFVTWFFTTFPYSLPNIVVSGCTFIGLTLGLLFLKDSSQFKKKKEEQQENKEQQEVQAVEMAEVKIEESKEQEVIQSSASSEEERVAKDDEILEEQTQKDQLSEMLPTSAATKYYKNYDFSKPSGIKFPKWWPKNEMFREVGPFLSIITYGILGSTQVTLDEVLPLFLILPVKSNGIGFSPREIGIIASICGFAILIYQSTLNAKLVKFLGAPKALTAAVTLWMVPTLIFPAISLIARPGILFTVITWTVLLVCYVIKTLSQSTMFLSIMLLVSNSVTPENMGKANGLSQSAVAFTRTVCPPIGSALYSWSLLNGLGFPFNVFFIFFVLASGQALLLFLSCLIPRKLAKPKLEALKESNSK